MFKARIIISHHWNPSFNLVPHVTTLTRQSGGLLFYGRYVPVLTPSCCHTSPSEGLLAVVALVRQPGFPIHQESLSSVLEQTDQGLRTVDVSEASLPGRHRAVFSPCPHTVFLPHVFVPYFLVRTMEALAESLLYWPHFTMMTPLRSFIFRYCHKQRSCSPACKLGKGGRT